MDVVAAAAEQQHVLVGRGMEVWKSNRLTMVSACVIEGIPYAKHHL